MLNRPPCGDQPHICGQTVGGRYRRINLILRRILYEIGLPATLRPVIPPPKQELEVLLEAQGNLDVGSPP